LSELVNRRVILAARPEGLPTDDCFEIRESAMGPVPADHVRIRVEAMSIDPAMRAWLEEDAYVAPVQLGDTMRALAVGEVIESDHESFSPGDWVQGPLGVQTYTDMPPFLMKRITPEEGVPPTAWLGAMGLTAGFTAYFGLYDCGQPKEGDVVLMSAAAGAVGSIAGQLARVRGARVIGIAGGPEKCAWVTGELGFDACIDYKGQDVHAEIGRLAPDGIDVFFDNVGGEILDHALDHLAQGARVVLCGAITAYNDRKNVQGPRLYLRIAERNARMEGFTADRFAPRFAEAEVELKALLKSGDLVIREHVEHGVENFAATLRILFDGSHMGKLLLAP